MQLDEIFLLRQPWRLLHVCVAFLFVNDHCRPSSFFQHIVWGVVVCFFSDKIDRMVAIKVGFLRMSAGGGKISGRSSQSTAFSSFLPPPLEIRRKFRDCGLS